MALDPAQSALALKLRDEDHLSYAAIAKAIGVSESMAWKHFNPRPPKPKPPPTAKSKKHPDAFLPPPKLLFHGSVPLRRIINWDVERNLPQMTKPEMYRDLAQAWSNTARLRA